jgi:cyclase
MHQVADSVWVETEHLGSNNSVIVTSDGVVLVDAPHKPSDAQRWAARVTEFGPVRYLVNTDHHPDHTIGNAWLPGTVVSYAGTRTTLKVAAPTDDYLRELFARIDPDAVELVDGYSVRLPQLVYSERLDLYLGDEVLELSFHPGHTANNTVAYLPSQRVVFTGDNVCSAGLPSFQDSTLSEWFDALDFIESLDADVVVPGHGDVGGPELIGAFRDLGRQLIHRVAGAINSGQSLERMASEIRFEDNIHVDTPCYVGYPDWLVETFQRNTIARLYRDLTAEPSLAKR